MKLDKIKYRKASLIPKEEGFEVFGPFIEACNFCGKPVHLLPYSFNREISPKTHCVFCLRNGFYTKNNRNVILVSFKNIIGYLYFEKYLREKRMYLSQVESFVKCHEEVGLRNPIFYYDPDTMYWFIDFNRVGMTRRKINITFVFQTIINILACFNLSETIPDLELDLLFSKYKEDILTRHQKFIMPSLESCVRSGAYIGEEKKFGNFQLKSIDKN